MAGRGSGGGTREEREARRDAYLRRTYGISLADFRAIARVQGGRCAICSRPLSQSANVDHCHRTNKVRGILCWKCNHVRLGAFMDSRDLIAAALAYLDNPPAEVVLVDI